MVEIDHMWQVRADNDLTSSIYTTTCVWSMQGLAPWNRIEGSSYIDRTVHDVATPLTNRYKRAPIAMYIE
jgi:hypothetical protein